MSANFGVCRRSGGAKLSMLLVEVSPAARDGGPGGQQTDLAGRSAGWSRGGRAQRGQSCADLLLAAVPVTLGYGAMDGSSRLDSDLNALLRRVGDRDVDAFTAFYDRTRARVFGLVMRVLRDPGYSEETTQDVYLQVWRDAGGFDPSAGSALAWLLTVAHRRAVDRVRAEQAAGQREDRYGASSLWPAGDVVADSTILRDEYRQVVSCLESLTDAQRECIQLAYYGGLTYSQVSDRLTVNLSTVKARIRAGLHRLRDCLGIP